MSNARMTFRFGDQELDKSENKGESASSLHNTKTAPSWASEDIPIDWGETTLTKPTRPDLDRSQPYVSPDMDNHGQGELADHPVYYAHTSNADSGSGHSHASDNEYDQDDNWLADRESYSYKRNRPPRGWKMIGSITGALVTGALFGVVILSFFNKDAPVNPSQAVTANPTVSAITGQEGTAGGEQQASVGNTYYALQYGVFSSPERAEQENLELAQAGIAAGSDPEDGNRVYAGISADREEAKLLSSRLKSQGVELYVKEIVSPEVNPAIFGGKQEDISLFFKSSSALVDQLSTLSIQQLGQSVPAAISPEMMNVLQNQHQSWLTGLSGLTPGLTADVQPLVTNMEKSMNRAITTIGEYNKNPDNAHMWSVQTDLMEYVLQQKKWLEAIKQ